jgi:ABC-type bacteriocin/lantibiotic exporter with double-glycine peptidase domain
MISKALDNISKMNITTITIAHKFLIIKNVDMIYILKEGKIFQKVSHEELVKNVGYNYEIIRTRLIRDELDRQNKKEKLDKKKKLYIKK